MHVRATTRPAAAVEAQWLAVGLFNGKDKDKDKDGGPIEPPAALRGTPLADLISKLQGSKDLGASVGDVTPVLGASGLAARGLTTFGLGSRDKFDPGAAYNAGVALARKLAARPRESVAVALPDAGDPSAIAPALIQGLIVGTRGTDLRKSEPARHPFGDLILVVPEELAIDLEAALRKGQVVGEAINLARDLANTPPSDKAPPALAGRFREVGREAGLEVEVWDEDRLRRERFGGLLGVAAGSDQPPAFVVLRHRGGDGPTTALVGKGVTFDSGGLSLKPSASMEDMKCDMTGGAVVLAALQAIARLASPVNVVGYVPMVENMTGGRALKLGDVLTHRNGKTVEVLNTDAEGRLILADALSYAVEHDPARVLDLATLTGACMVALGTKVAGLFSNDDPWADRVLAAARSVGERAWRLPLDADYLDGLKSGVADLKNVGGKWGGSITAAKFLEQFVGETPWAHLDIAGPSWADSDNSTRDAGGTGCFVRTLVALCDG
ncbi:MAG TPA: leucyl aminopeptidase [Isosphaeraceae bacterium]|jgi:leucyl aminopeptidase|nr:leucyl aminopeptidase [Isosphaeraceae bacterium]